MGYTEIMLLIVVALLLVAIWQLDRIRDHLGF